MNTERRIGKLKDRLGQIKEDGLKRLQKKLKKRAKQQHMKTLYTLTKVLSNERPRQSAAVMEKRKRQDP